jgi:hypothetical protein
VWCRSVQPATLICTPSSVPENDGVLIQNLGSGTLYIGGSTVTANTTSTGGLQVAANATVNVPTTGSRRVQPGIARTT